MSDSDEDGGTNSLPDWSGRHVRLRFEMLLCSIVFYLLSTGHAELNDESIWPIKLTHPDANGYVLAIIGSIYCYVFVAFLLRTKLEWDPISRFQEELSTAIGKISVSASKFSEVVSAYSPVKIVEMLSAWRDDFPRDAVMSSGEIEKCRDRIMQAFVSLAADIKAIGGPPDRKFLTLQQIGDRSEFLPTQMSGFHTLIDGQLENINKSNSEMDRVCAEVTQQFADMISFFENGALSKIEHIHDDTRDNIQKLISLRTSLSRGRTVFSWERFIVSFLVPVLASLLLMAYSVWSLLPPGFCLWCSR